jgi:DNA-binding transcriptional LysR family regulator
MARPAAELPTTSSILTTVIAGSVPAVVSILAARDALTSGQLVRVKITDIRIVRPLTAVWLRTTAELPEELQDLLRIATA